MIVDARSVGANEIVEADVCIAGAGIAGMTIARQLVGEEFRVCLLESGGLEPDWVTQSLYWGENVGYPYYPLDTHGARAFGGTSHRWSVELGCGVQGVRLRPLDAIHFQERPWVPYSGWPFDRAHLDPFYERAQAVCQIGPYRYDSGAWEDAQSAPPLPLDSRVETVIFQFGQRAPFLGEYQQDICNAANIATFLYANVVEVDTTESGQEVACLHVACLGGNRFSVRARLFILATGGIETPRLLLLSNRRYSAGLGNQHDLVGRFFMEHPHLWSGVYVPSDPDIFRRARLYRLHHVNGVPIMAKLALSEDTQRREQLLGYCVSIHPSSRREAQAVQRRERRSGIRGVVGAAVRKARREVDRTADRFRSPRPEVFRLDHMSEQAPNPESRVTLGDERDVLGCRRAQLDWRMTALDIRTIVRAQQILSEELQQAGLGHIEIELRHDSPTPPGVMGGYHQMGTTRMHKDPRYGVVDEHCRVHGLSNLFIAGSSVFPTVGYANPVLTLVALALRLADHTKRVMA